MSWWIGELLSNGRYIEFVSWTFWVIASITLHELAHGWVALWEGDDTPRRKSHLTSNPLVHMGWWSLLAFAIVGIAWGAMPVNPYRFRHRKWGNALVAAAGPMMNVTLALLTLTGLALWMRFGPDDTHAAMNVATFLTLGGMLNIVLALLNIIPVPPLDGSRILAGVSRGYAALIAKPEAAQLSMLALLVILFGAGSLLFRAGTAITAWYLELLGAIL